MRHENDINFEPQIEEVTIREKTLLEIFATFNSSIVLLATQVNRKIESDIEFSGRCDQVTLRVYSETKDTSVLNDGRHRGFVFVS